MGADAVVVSNHGGRVLYGIKIPRRNGQPLGCTEFSNMRAAYNDLPDELKRKIEGRTATHDFNKFWEAMRREKGSKRPPLTPEQRAKKPPVSQPMVLEHPITGEQVLYANPGYTMHIDGIDKAASDEILAFLFKHQLQEKYRYKHMWTENDVLMWDNFGTIHNAVADGKSFTGAARQLGVSRTSVTKIIAGLEARLGIRLLIRSTHNVSLTSAITWHRLMSRCSSGV